MVSVKVDFVKKDFFWIVLLIVFVGISLVYAYVLDGSGNPSVMGHSAGEIELPSGTLAGYCATAAIGPPLIVIAPAVAIGDYCSCESGWEKIMTGRFTTSWNSCIKI